MKDDETTVNGRVHSRAQLFGVLSKKHSASQSASSGKWAKRFFVVRDGFLLYYAESEFREFEKQKCLNLNPKISSETAADGIIAVAIVEGIVPMGNCDIQSLSELGHPYSIQIISCELPVPMVIATETEYEREKWLSVLQQSSRITWNNAQLGDVMIRQLENQGMQMAVEKQNYFDKLQVEAMALHEEKLRADELVQLNEVLAKEREKFENLAAELTEEYELLKRELSEKNADMKSVEESKLDLVSTTDKLKEQLEALEREREKTQQQLAAGAGEDFSRAVTSSHDNGSKTNSNSTAESLKHELLSINEQTEMLLADKAAAESRLREYLERELQLEEEKRLLSKHAEELNASLKELTAQKAMTEIELRDEMVARKAAERRLQEAEQRLNRLEHGIKQQGGGEKEEEARREEMIGDVKAIKQFFESLAVEVKLEGNNSTLVKNAVQARKVMRRAQSMKSESLLQQRHSKTQSRELVLESFRNSQFVNDV